MPLWIDIAGILLSRFVGHLWQLLTVLDSRVADTQFHKVVVPLLVDRSRQPEGRDNRVVNVRVCELARVALDEAED